MNLTKISKINIIIYKITKLKTKIENFWEFPSKIFEIKIEKIKGHFKKNTEKAEQRVKIRTSHIQQEAATTLLCALCCIFMN